MHEEEESTAVAADVPGDLPEDENALPPEVRTAPPQDAAPPPPDVWYSVEHNCRPGEFTSRGPADGLLYRRRRHM
jgi:hypothetical protein